MQTLTTAVQTHRDLLVRNMYIQQQIGIRHLYIRPLAGFGRPVINNRILHAVRYKTTVAKILTVHRRIDSKTRIRRHVPTPVYTLQLLIQAVRVFGTKTDNRNQYTQGRAQT